jgi:S-adenosylmethionine decarboxylase proenzyme
MRQQALSLKAYIGKGDIHMENLENSSPDGIHYIIEFFGCRKDQLDAVAFWRKLLLNSVKDLKVRVLNGHFYKFKPHGITGYLLLSASHISIHTWYEYGYVACDVFSCSGDDEAVAIVSKIKKNLTYERIKTRKIKRGFKVTS